MRAFFKKMRSFVNGYDGYILLAILIVLILK